MRAGRPLALALFLLASWDAQAQPGGPVDTTVKYYEAARKSRCPEVWALYSKGTQEHIRAEVRGRVKERGGSPAEERPEEFACSMIDKHKRLNERLVRMQGDEATVAVLMRGRVSKSRWDIPGTMTEWTDEVKLVREGGAWKIDLPRPKGEKPLGTLLEIGEVNVSIGHVTAQQHQVFEATAISRVPGDALDAVLRDPRAWAAVLPSFKAIEPGERTGKVGRALLSFADPATPVPVVVRLAGTASAKAGFTSLLWHAEQEFKAPVYMRGEWYLGANANGTTRVKLTIVIDRRHWPGSEKLFSAERLGNSVLALEKAAGKAPPTAAR